ncbi:hypothetical protein [Mucilaginibacter sp. dw_454]|uniref:hypothetical protein n=1 Tax=Mucilaginibacter sp. dw_454 TaxID=2720079 RepID=UPI001BD6003C|nr:hypothetical protein [Mucilaginibacter sp. dw_454]
MSTTTLNHTYRHFADLQLSTKEFYKKLEERIKSYEYPADVQVYRANLSTSGIFSVKREYLVICYRSYVYYVCAAPFGRSFFITWWFQYERSGFLEWLFVSRIMSALFEDKEKTMFRKDTRLMFQNSVNDIITELSATVQPTHGIRPTAPLAQQHLS